MNQRAWVLGSPTGQYVQQLAAAAPVGWTVDLLQYEMLEATLAPGNPSMKNHLVYADDLILVRSMGRGNLESIVFRMDCLAAMESQGTRILNPPKALEWSIDKFASLQRLAHVGLPIPLTHVSQTCDAAIRGFHQLHGDVVVKPIFGSEGRGLIHVADEDHAERVFRSLEEMERVIYQQAFLGTGWRDIRILIVGDDWWAIERTGGDWRKNLARGAMANVYTPSRAEQDIAFRAAGTLSLPVAGVDLMLGPEGQTLVLEVNGIPGWAGIESTHPVAIADRIWRLAQQDHRWRPCPKA